jgi:hypothetical protein
VAEDEEPDPAGRPVEPPHHRVAERRVGMDRDGRTEALEVARRPAARLVDPGLRVAPAVDPDERREVREEGGEPPLDERAEPGELRLADPRPGRVRYGQIASSCGRSGRTWTA